MKKAQKNITSRGLIGLERYNPSREVVHIPKAVSKTPPDSPEKSRALIDRGDPLCETKFAPSYAAGRIR